VVPHVLSRPRVRPRVVDEIARDGPARRVGLRLAQPSGRNTASGAVREAPQTWVVQQGLQVPGSTDESGAKEITVAEDSESALGASQMLTGRGRQHVLMPEASRMSPEAHIVRIAMSRASQPRRNATPPNGVTAPHRGLPVKASA
jgi:hypothetical protein